MFTYSVSQFQTPDTYNVYAVFKRNDQTILVEELVLRVRGSDPVLDESRGNMTSSLQQEYTLRVSNPGNTCRWQRMLQYQSRSGNVFLAVVTVSY